MFARPGANLPSLPLSAAAISRQNISRLIVEMPAKFKEGETWDEARPRDDVPSGPWWRSLNDRLLNDLEPQVDISNQDLAAALAAIDQARAFTAKAQRACCRPSISTTAIPPTNSPRIVPRARRTRHSPPPAMPN